MSEFRRFEFHFYQKQSYYNNQIYLHDVVLNVMLNLEREISSMSTSVDCKEVCFIIRHEKYRLSNEIRV